MFYVGYKSYNSRAFFMRHTTLVSTTILSCLCATAFIAAPASAAVMITLVASAGPVSASPSYGSYASNAIYALRNGLSNYGGDQSVTPTAYAVLGASANIGMSMLSVNLTNPSSGFNSWMGQLNPTDAFANEKGNMIYFGATMVASVGTQIQLDHIFVNVTRADSAGLPGNILQSNSGTFSGNYTPYRMGVLRGADGILGTGDDIVINSGNASQFVDALYLAGAGTSIVSNSPAEMTEFMNTFGSTIGSVNLTGTWKLLDGAGVGNVLESTSLTVALVPAPSAVALIGLVSAFMGRRRRN